jgi:hypothetical protein
MQYLLKLLKFNRINYIKFILSSCNNIFVLEFIIVNNNPFTAIKTIYIPEVSCTPIITSYYILIPNSMSPLLYTLLNSLPISLDEFLPCQAAVVVNPT